MARVEDHSKVTDLCTRPKGKTGGKEGIEGGLAGFDFFVSPLSMLEMFVGFLDFWILHFGRSSCGRGVGSKLDTLLNFGLRVADR